MAVSFAIAGTSCDDHQRNSAFHIPKHHFAKRWESMHAHKKCWTQAPFCGLETWQAASKKWSNLPQSLFVLHLSKGLKPLHV